MAANPPRYEAFISYRHVPADEAAAKRVQHALEGFRIPRALRRDGRRSLGRLFRDEDELPASSSLTDEISRALCDSRYLIVVCSPDTPSSAWVNLEIDQFLDLHGPDRILAVLIAGEPEKSFPAALLDQAERGHEPLAADFRPGKTSRELHREELRLAAALIGCGLDNLVNRRRVRAAKIAAAAACGAAVVGGVIGWQASQLRDAQTTQLIEQSEQLASKSGALLDRGLRMEAIQVAAAALPQTEDARDRPLVPSALNALADALGVYPTNLLNWRPAYSIDDLPNPGAYAASAEGNWIAVWMSPQHVDVHNLETGARLGSLVAPGDTSFTDTLFSAGQSVACVMEDGSVVAYDAQTGEQSWSFDRPVVAAECAGDGSVVAILTVDNGMYLEIAMVGTERGDVIFSTPLNVPYSGDECLGLSEDFSRAAVVSGGSLVLVDFATQSSRTAPYSGAPASSVLVSGQVYVAGTSHAESQEERSGGSEGTVSAYATDSLALLWERDVSWDPYVPDFADVPFNPPPHLVSIISQGERPEQALVLSVGNHMLALDSSTGSVLEDRETGTPVVCVSALELSGEDAFLYTTFDGTRSFFAPCDPGSQTKEDGAEWFRVPFSLAAGEDVGRRFIACNAESASSIVVFETSAASDLPGYEPLGAAAPNTVRVSTTGYVAWVGENDNRLHCVSPEGSGDKTASIDLSTLGIDLPDDSLTLFFSSADPSILLVCREGVGTTPPALWAISARTADPIASWTWSYETPDFGFDASWFSAERDGQMTVHIDTYLCTLEVPSLDVINEFTGTDEIPLRDDLMVGDFLVALWNWPEGGVLSIHNPETNDVVESTLSDHYVSSGTTLDGYVARSDDETLLAVACADGMLRLFDLGAMEWRWEVPFSSLASSFLLFSPDGRSLFAQDDAGTCATYDVTTGELLGVEADASIERCGVLLSGHFSDDGTQVICSGMNLSMERFLTIFDVTNGSCQLTARIPDARGIVSGEGTVVLQSGELAYTLPLYTHTELLDVAEEVTRGHELTQEERELYHLD